MTDAVTCPNCRDVLDVPTEFRGRSVKCGTCQTVFPVPEPTLSITELPTARRDRPLFVNEHRSQKQSNRVVWFLLLATALVLGGLFVACGGLMVWMNNPTMTVHNSEEGKFQVEFPSEPQPIAQAGEHGVIVKGLEAKRKLAEGRYFVKYYDLSKKQLAGDPETILNDALKTEIAGLAAGNEIQRQMTKHAGFPAIDVELHQGSEFMQRITVLRIILAGSRVYILGTQGQNQLPQFAYVQQFFISFRTTVKVAPLLKPALDE
jgi:LSD1 subclass zinc finger protein